MDIFKHGVMFNLSIGHPRNFKDVDQNNILCKPFTFYEMRARALLNKYSFQLLGSRFVPNNAIVPLINGIDGESSLIEEQTDFFYKLDSIIQDAKNIKEFAETLKIDVESIRDKYIFEWNAYIPVTIENLPGNIFSHKINNFVKEASVELINRTNEYLNTFKIAATKGSTIKSSSYNAVLRGINEFRLMNFMNIEGYADKINDIENNIYSQVVINKIDNCLNFNSQPVGV